MMQVQRFQWGNPYHNPLEYKFGNEIDELPVAVPISSIQSQFSDLDLPIPKEEVITQLFFAAFTIQTGTSYKIRQQDDFDDAAIKNYLIASSESRIEIYVHLQESLQAGSYYKVKQAIRVIIDRATAEPLVQKQVRYSRILDTAENIGYVINRIKMGETFKDSPHVLPISFWARYQKKSKVHIYAPRLDMDFLELLGQYRLKISENGMLKLLLDLANGLCDFSQKKLVHRDIKPENIFLNGNENADGLFEITRALIGDLDFCIPESQFQFHSIDSGTCMYLSPERLCYFLGLQKPLKKIMKIIGINFSNQAPAFFGKPSDLWGVGCILYAYKKGCFLPWMETLETLFNKEMQLRKFKDSVSEEADQLSNEIDDLALQAEEEILAFASTYQPDPDDVFGGLIYKLLKIRPDERLTAVELLEIVKNEAVKRGIV